MRIFTSLYLLVCLNLAANAQVVTSNSSDTVNCDGWALLDSTYTPIKWFNLAGSQIAAGTILVEQLCPGDYFVIVNSPQQTLDTLPFSIGLGTNNCSGFSAIVSTTPTGFQSNCNGTASVTVTGGVAPYTYTWNGNSSGSSHLESQCSGTYTVVVSDAAGCQVALQYVVDFIPDSGAGSCPNPPSVFISGNSQIVHGDSTLLVANSNSIVAYQWSTGQTSSGIVVSPQVSTQYSVVVTDSLGCQGVATFIVTVLPDSGSGDCNGFSITTTLLNSTSADTCTGRAVVSIVGGVPPYSITWSGGAGNQLEAVDLCQGAYTVTVVDSNQCSLTSTVTVDVILDSLGGNPCANFAVDLLPTQPSANACNGAIDVVVTSGTAPFVYMWSDSLLMGGNLVGLCAGAYSVMVTDANGCQAYASINLQSPDSCFGFYVTIDSVFNETFPGACNGVAVAFAYNGTAPFNFNWGNGIASNVGTISGLCAGPINLLVTDANGCVANASGFVNSNTISVGQCAGVNVTVSFTVQDAGQGLCNGSVTSFVSGGAAPYSFSWSNGFLTSNLVNACPGYYSLRVVDNNGCLGGAVVFVGGDSVVPVPLAVNIIATNASAANACDGAVRLNIAGGVAPYTITYSNGAAGTQLLGLCPDIYGVFVSDAIGQTAALTFVIASPGDVFTASNNPLNDSVVVATLETNAVENCDIDLNGIDSILVTGYFLNDDDSLVVEWTIYSFTNGDTVEYVTYEIGPDGVYEVILAIYCPGRTTQGFVKAQDKVQVNSNHLTGIKFVNRAISSKLYPNPFNTNLTLVSSEAGLVLVKDLSGKLVYSKTINKGETTLNLSELSSGIYFVTLQTISKIETLKLIKE